MRLAGVSECLTRQSGGAAGSGVACPVLSIRRWIFCAVAGKAFPLPSGIYTYRWRPGASWFILRRDLPFPLFLSMRTVRVLQRQGSGSSPPGWDNSSFPAAMVVYTTTTETALSSENGREVTARMTSPISHHFGRGLCSVFLNQAELLTLSKDSVLKTKPGWRQPRGVSKWDHRWAAVWKIKAAFRLPLYQQ